MAERTHKTRPSSSPREGQQVESTDAAVSDYGERIKAELDDLLDEIDDVLETNAEDFVKSYVQKGGE
ncbi:MAG: ubiquitin-like protein Pup [Actinomycetota bacterium]